MVVCVPAHTTGHFTPQIPVDLEAGWADSYGEEKIFCPARIRNLESPARSPVAVPTTVLRFLGACTDVV